MSGDRYNVYSVNQQGGITAGQVNIGKVPRTLNSDIKRQLRALVPSGSKVQVECALGDAEAYRFASEILEFFRGEGYDATGITQGVYVPPLPPQGVNKNTPGLIKIQIGSNT